MTQSVDRSHFDQYMTPNYAPMSFVPVRGEGSRVWDRRDTMMIDLTGGIAVNVLGHAHPALQQAVTEQASKLWHVSNIFTNEPALEVAQMLVANTFADKVFFANSGAEANEAALKLARRYAWQKTGGKRFKILSTLNSFHGRTLFTVSAGGQPKYREGFEPAPEGIAHVPYNDLQAMKDAIDDTCCAIIVEPIQGEGGVIPAHKAYLEGLRALCNEHDLLLIFDEVQTGVGRTGSLYAYQHYGVVPDILSTAKSLGGGFPISAMLTTENVGAALQVGTHGTTYGGNPLACAVAKAVLTEVLKPELMNNVQARHEQLVDGLAKINQELALFEEVRGAGLLIGAGLVPQWQGKAGQLMAAAQEAGVLILVAGPNTLRFAPALNITEAELSEALEKLTTALRQATNS
ncbi:acetylornithine/succinyldiaminopimelate transaminase [Salinibius halmophilus]|uniref:acetylornithine/succinyldiaminopimelate transaminase n=1 Tax=Salinibius halmophilus TaxID=1853216 RepID=UPI000E66C63F|nr:acetylornithine/succinyldiaminopimelate transaminase [Salinibius halmophilus]